MVSDTCNRPQGASYAHSAIVHQLLYFTLLHTPLQTQRFGVETGRQLEAEIGPTL